MTRMSRTRSTLIAALVAALFIPVGGAASGASSRAQATGAPASCGTQRPVWTPNPWGAQRYDTLAGVAALSATNVVAVGDSSSPAHPDASRAIAERWDGSAWSDLSPDHAAGDGGRTLAGVARIDAHAAWAVGSKHRGSHLHRTLVERLSGSTWTIVPSPNVADQENALVGVVSLSTGNAWAVGTSTEHITDLSTWSEPLALHWNGTSWAIATTPNVSDGGGFAEVAMRTATDGWAVGSRGAQNEGSPQTLIERWDGTAWHIVPSPNGPAHDGQLEGVAVRSASDAIAVGSSNAGPLAVRWNGTSWTRMTLPAEIRSLWAVALAGDGSAYAVGYAYTGGSFHPIVVRWNGSSWSRMPISTASLDPTLQAVAVVSPTNVISVGDRHYGDHGITFAVHCTP